MLLVMRQMLAVADSGPAPDAALKLTGLCGGIVILAVLFAIMPLAVARRRGLRQWELFVTAALFWILLTAGSGIYTALQQWRWGNEQNERFETGYYTTDQANADAPTLPWMAWAILLAIYGALIFWAATGAGELMQAQSDRAEDTGKTSS